MTDRPPLSVLVVDDEELARSRLRELLADVADEAPNIIAAEADNGVSAIQAIEGRTIDAAFIDIRMPKMDGIELARHLGRLDKPPAIVFVTAYDNYAVQAFELNAVDYLLKPVRASRLAAALHKLRQMRPLPEPILAGLQKGGRTHLSCHERGRLLLVAVHDILYFKADLKYVTARTLSREYLLDESLARLEEEFSTRFIRSHRSVLLAREAITGFEKGFGDDAEAPWQALLHGLPEKLPISRRQWAAVKSCFKLTK